MPNPPQIAIENCGPTCVPVKPANCPTGATLARSVTSKDLFGEARIVFIQHGGEQYRLIVTKNDKLILQK
ncbi:hemin uptake protein HemP [Botrimarina sp.]|uniref:hemin uptake protein HemP n=1 Tax=Botrimarina sp. TaxID=2795802 RepID=UPI0032ED065D